MEQTLTVENSKFKLKYKFLSRNYIGKSNSGTNQYRKVFVSTILIIGLAFFCRTRIYIKFVLLTFKFLNCLRGLIFPEGRKRKFLHK